MESIAVSDFRANLMKVLKQIEHGASLDITSRGKVVAKLVPPDYTRNLAREKLDALRKTTKIYDVLSPIDEKWKVESR